MNYKEKARQLIEETKDLKSPKISLVMPTHKTSPDNRKDKILFKNLLQDLKAALESDYDKANYESTLELLNNLQEDSMFWNHNENGLLVLACGEKVESFRLQEEVDDKISVSDAYHLQPLFMHHDLYGKNYLVDLAKDRFSIYKINNGQIQEMSDTEIKTSFSELYDDFDQDANVNVGNYGGLSGMYHGHREKSNETKKDREKYFRYLDKEFKRLHRLEDSQFIFSGTKENIAIFKKLSQEDFYHELAIEKPLASIKQENLSNKIDEILKPLIEESLESLHNEIRKAEGENKALNDLDSIKDYANQGRIKKVIIKHKPTLSVNIPLDEALNTVIAYGGDIVVLSEDDFKESHDLIAIVR
jgi:hypothetical protein